jgi:hypothetical protein
MIGKVNYLFLIIIVMLIFFVAFGCREPGQSTTISESTTSQPATVHEPDLSKFTEIFKKDTIIITGNMASNTELESAKDIIDYLKELTGIEFPLLKDSEVTSENQSNNNLILVGTPNSNQLLKVISEKSGLSLLTTEYPGKNKGLLEIFRNPWNINKTTLVLAGSDECGVKAATTLLKQDELVALLKGTFLVTDEFIIITGKIVTIGNAPFIRLALKTEGDTYELTGIIAKKGERLWSLQYWQVEIAGFLEQRASLSSDIKNIHVMEFKEIEQ